MESPEVVAIDALDQANAALGRHPQSANSAHSARDGGNKKESTVQLRVVIPAPNSPPCPLPGNTIVSTDEARLLGESPKHDPTAIAIMKPSANQGNTYKRKNQIPSGFQPKNTLGQSSNAHQAPTGGHFAGFSSSTGRKRNRLEIGLSVGDNVKQLGQEFGLIVPLVGEPQPKRKKLRSPHNPAKHLEPNGLNRSDVLHNRQPPNIIQQSQHHACEDYSQSLTSNTTDDYIKPQKNLVSNKSKAKQKAEGQTAEKPESVTLHSPDTSPTQVSFGNPLHNAALLPSSRRAYKGTARTVSSIALRPGSLARGTSQADSDGKSKYFQSDRGTGKPSRMNQHRECNGRRLVSDVRNLSSDELESETTIGNHAVVNLASSDKRLRSTSPAKNLGSNSSALSTRDKFGGLAPSTIPSTKFWTGAKTGQQSMNSPPLSVEFRQKESESWGVELGSIVGKNLVMIKGLDLGLEFNSKDQVYCVQLQGQKQGPSYQIDPKSVLKATGAKGGKKLRFEFPLGEKIDIQLLRESDASAILEHMDKIRPLKIDWKPIGWMDKDFDKREKFDYPKKSRRACEDEPLDVQMAKINKQRREDAQRIVTPHDEADPKCKRRRMIDGMHAEDFNNTEVQVGPEQMKVQDQIDDILAANLNSRYQDLFNVSRFTRSIHQRTPNLHLSGSRAKLHRSARQTKRLPTQEEILQSLIPCKSVDLGPPWKKPLLFPKDGKKKASVEFSDLERLEEGQFLNDNLIGFYLRYLEQRLEDTKPDIANKVYFFNTFFFASLTNTQRGKRDINYEAVQKWTRSIDIFAFEYIIVPINESAHWYLAIICNLPAIRSDLPEDKSSAAIKDPFSLDSRRHFEDNSIGPAILDDRPSSPIGDVAFLDHVQSSLNQSEGEADSVDHAPTASFAELSLDTEPNGGSSVTNPHASNHKAIQPQSRAQEQGLLDAQINDDLAQVTAQVLETAPLVSEDAKQTQDKEASVLPLDQKAQGSAKKRKRKSVAPIMRMNPDSPAIITFDSLGLTHSPTIRILKNYLHEEGRAKQSFEWDDTSIKGVTARDIPEQDNLCDCGLFLLGYVDKFLDNPKEFTSKIIARQYDVQKDWPRLNASTLRVNIRKQILCLHEEQQRDRRENARKSDTAHGKEPHAGKRGNSKDRAQVEKGREVPQSPHNTTPSLRSSPTLDIDSKRTLAQDEASETTLGKNVRAKINPREAQSASPTLSSRLRSFEAEINPRKGLTRKEALAGASEIGAPEPQMLVNSFEDESGEDASFSEDNADHHIPKPQLGYDVDHQPSHAAINGGRSQNERICQCDASLRFSSSPSVDSTEVVDDARALVGMPSVIEDSQPDASQDFLGQQFFQSIIEAAVGQADEGTGLELHRSPPTGLKAERQMPPESRVMRSSNTRKQGEKSIIEIDD